ncbi:MAG: AMP-binding protein, partial [Clostridia bacterium]|nr:AMP-binding protein [Clostridia bacterium]
MKPYYKVRKIDDLRQMLRSSSELFGDSTLFLWKNGTPNYEPYSFNRFRSDVEAFGAYLWNKGYAGRKIIVTGENCYPWAVTYMATICGLGVIVPVDKEINAEEIANIANICDAAAIVHSKTVSKKLENVTIDKICFDDIFACIEEGRALIEAGNTAYLNTSIDRDALASLIFTSGTTGVSKGVMLSHHNLCANLMGMNQMMCVGPGDVFLSVLPMHHVYECTCTFLESIYRGTTMAFCEGLRYVVKNLQECKATVVLAVPVLLESIYKKIWAGAEKSGKADTLRKAIKLNNGLKKVGIDLSRKLFKDVHANFGGNLRILIAGGAKIETEVLSGLRDLGFMARQGYGLSECSPIAAFNRDCCFMDESAGQALPGTELDIVNVAEDGTGEIRVKGENVMLGYYNAPDLSAEVLKDGWFYTGDIG